MIRILAIFLGLAAPAAAETIVAAKNLPAQSIIGFEDLLMRDVTIAGGVSDPFLLVGKETTTAIYAGRPVRPSDVTDPAIVERNQVIPLIYENSTLSIRTEGRALARGSIGMKINIMNLSSRTTVLAELRADGSAYVSN